MKKRQIGRDPGRVPAPAADTGASAPAEDATRGRFLMQVLWPSFLVAVPCVGIFFSAIDPAELAIVGDWLDGSRRGAYTLGFLLAWLALAAASGLTYLLAHRPRQG